MRVLLAMSGGVDSSVAAVLLKQQGFDVVGVFMRTGVHQNSECETEPRSNKKGCCSALDASDARRVADRLDIPFYAFDFEEDFDKIIDYFADEYLAGRTPNPCVVCNTWLKFGKLWEFAQQIGAERIATGHYARVENGALLQAIDPAKDQSYVLFGLKRELLWRLLFPIGGKPKDEVRALAREFGLGVAEKPDSVEICFVPGGDHAAVIRARRPELATAGKIVDTTGATLGEHDGYERFTIGQRRGLGVAGESRRYVLDIVPETREIVLGDPDYLRSTGLRATRVNWLIDPPASELRCRAKIRYRHSPAEALVMPLPNDEVEVRFDETQTAVTPGQAVVFYKDDRVLGGGWIESSTRATPDDNT